MSKRMIDFDVLMKCVNSLYTRCQVPNEGDYSLFMISKQPELSNIFMNCLDVLVREINELATLATKPQESIFDADGWCWDLSLINNDDEYHFLIESHREGVGHKVTGKKSYYQGIGLTWFVEENLKENEYSGDKIIAWRPLAPTPKEA